MLDGNIVDHHMMACYNVVLILATNNQPKIAPGGISGIIPVPSYMRSFRAIADQ